ncbi:MAG: type IV pilin N-terminal domain-containing protein [Methanomicrobiales archaeon]|nr:type IV pilin N-terminal domain-containing protein [Methanomicrobiales archaeon]
MKRNDEAVSPVIGVMLMLVVTIIIAAVVSGFAGGLAGGAKTAPQATIQVKTGYGYNIYGTALNMSNFDISFEHLSGDPIPTKDIEIITYLTLPDGTVVKHKQTASSVVDCTSTGSPQNYARIPFIRDQTLGTYYNNSTDIDAGKTNPLWFGEYVFQPGQVIRTYKKGATAGFLGLIADSDRYPYNQTAYDDGAAILEDCIQKGCPVDIKWLHVPSGKYILDTTITLQG